MSKHYTNDFDMQPFDLLTSIQKMGDRLKYGATFSTAEMRVILGVPYLNPKGRGVLAHRYNTVQSQAQIRRRKLRTALMSSHKMALEWMNVETYYWIVPISKCKVHFQNKYNTAELSARTHSVKQLSGVLSKMNNPDRAETQALLDELQKRNLV